MVKEVVQAAEWLTSVIKDKDTILNGDSVLKLSNIDTSNEAGRRLYGSAKQILSNLGIDKDEISIDNASDSKAIFDGTRFNGDGVIPVSAAEDDAHKQVIADCIATIGSVTDRSGEPGVTAELLDKFYAACADYAAWKDKADETVLPYGDNTGAAYDAYNALKDKISDYFMRCRLLAFDPVVAESVSVSVTDIASVADCPLAKPSTSGLLPFNATILHGKLRSTRSSLSCSERNLTAVRVLPLLNGIWWQPSSMLTLHGLQTRKAARWSRLELTESVLSWPIIIMLICWSLWLVMWQ